MLPIGQVVSEDMIKMWKVYEKQIDEGEMTDIEWWQKSYDHTGQVS